MTSGATIDVAAALDAGCDFIWEELSEDGLWRDFQTLAGESSDWVTAFVWYALAQRLERETRDWLPLTTLLGRQRETGGWAYNEDVPCDADSTAWTVLALSTMPGWRPSTLLRSMRYLQMHQRPGSGGFATYAPLDGIDRYIDAAPELTDGWLTAHQCVTGVVVGAMLAAGEKPSSAPIENGVAYLLEQRDPDRLWRSYWWPGRSYATYHAVRALVWARRWRYDGAIPTIRAIVERQRPDGSWPLGDGEEGSVFETSWALLTLLLVDPRQTRREVAAATAWLVEQQQYDGSWPTLPILRIPAPMIALPDDVSEWRENEQGTNVIIADEHRLFTTATAFWALSAAASLSSPARES